MGWLGIRALVATLGAAVAVLAVAAAAGLVRLMPWLLAPEVPARVTLPFARALGAAATETAMLVALPLGFALAAATAVDRGEVRALAALGVSELRLVGSQWRHAALGSALAFVACLAWGSTSDVPGRFAAQLVQQGRSSCASVREPRSITVPLVGVTWLCFPGQPPRVSGPLPGSRGRAWFSATQLTPSDDLREVSLVDLQVVTQAPAGERRLRLQTRDGVVRGLPAWGRSATLSAPKRSALAALTALVLALGASFLVLRAGLSRRWHALVGGGTPAVAALIVLHRLDASGLGPLTYAAVPLAGASILLLLALLARRVARTPAR